MILVLSSLFVLRTDIVCTVCIVNELALALALTASIVTPGIQSLRCPCRVLCFKGGVERISTFLNKAHQGIQLCLGNSEKIETKIFVLV